MADAELTAKIESQGLAIRELKVRSHELLKLVQLFPSRNLLFNPFCTNTGSKSSQRSNSSCCGSVISTEGRIQDRDGQ